MKILNKSNERIEMNTTLRIILTICFALHFASRVGLSDDFQLDLTAEPESRWYDYYSDAFAEVGQGWRGDDELDGFFLTSQLPTYTPIGGGADVFPFDGDFTNIGSVEFDLATGEINDLTMDVDNFVAFNFSVLNSVLGDGYDTTLSNVNGMVTADNGNVSAIDLSADITFTYGSVEPDIVPYNGTFTIQGNRFELFVDEAVLIKGFGTFRYGWDFFGTVDGLSELSVPGDFNDDRQLTAEDIDILSGAILANDNASRFDLNSDGVVDSSDREFWVQQLKATFLGDSDLNGQFDEQDIVAAFIQGEYLSAGAAGWAAGDWDGNLLFNEQDFVQAFIAGGYLQGPRVAVAVPEPSTTMLLGLALLAMGVRFRRI